MTGPIEDVSSLPGMKVTDQEEITIGKVKEIYAIDGDGHGDEDQLDVLDHRRPDVVAVPVDPVPVDGVSPPLTRPSGARDGTPRRSRRSP